MIRQARGVGQLHHHVRELQAHGLIVSPRRNQVHPDWQIDGRHALEQLQILGPIQRLPVPHSTAESHSVPGDRGGRR